MDSVSVIVVVSQVVVDICEVKELVSDVVVEEMEV